MGHLFWPLTEEIIHRKNICKWSCCELSWDLQVCPNAISIQIIESDHFGTPSADQTEDDTRQPEVEITNGDEANVDDAIDFDDDSDAYSDDSYQQFIYDQFNSDSDSDGDSVGSASIHSGSSRASRTSAGSTKTLMTPMKTDNCELYLGLSAPAPWKGSIFEFLMPTTSTSTIGSFGDVSAERSGQKKKPTKNYKEFLAASG